MQKIKATVNRVVSDVFKDNATDVYFGYDCISIKISKDNSLDTMLLCDLKDKLDSDLPVSIDISNDGNFEVSVDISNIIIGEFGSWSAYDNFYWDIIT